MSELEKSVEEFCLTPPEPKKKKRFLPENVISLEVAKPPEQIITIIVLIRDEGGNIIRVPVGWDPSTKVIKRMTKQSWAELGIEKHISRIRNSAIKMAKKQHKEIVLKYSTRDMFNDSATDA